MGVIDHIARTITQVVSPVYVLRAPMVVSIFAAVMLAFPDQTLEIYRAIALGHTELWPQITLAFLTLLVAGILIWYLSRNLTLKWQKSELAMSSLSGVLLRWLPRLLGALPLFGAAYGMYVAGGNLKQIQVPQIAQAQMPAAVGPLIDARLGYEVARQLLLYASAVAAVLGVLIIVVTFLRAYRKQWKYEHPNPWLFSFPVRLFFYALNIGLVIAFSAFLIGARESYGLLADSVGVLAIFNLFVIGIAFFATALTNLYDTTKVPGLSCLVVMALVATAFDLNDNHEIRALPQQRLPLIPPSKIVLEPWLASRPDRAFFESRGQPYPIYIVAAQGGGIYAALHASLTLARMQDRCPAFAQHIFAISGVSGGSLGAALFNSLVKAKAKPVTTPDCLFGEQPPGEYEKAVRKFLGRDFLSPLAAAGLYPDFLQRFIPYPIPQFDRARALEATFESAWAELMPKGTPNAFAESYLKHWDVEGIAPALVLNATRVETGNRVLIAPFKFNENASQHLKTINTLTRLDMPLSTAVGISARFPWVLPPASYQRGPETQYRFVDGGYFESSGLDTALDLVQVLEDTLATLPERGLPVPNVEINLILLTTDDILQDPDPKKSEYAQIVQQALDKPRGFDEIGSPISTMLAARWQRGVVSMSRAMERFCPGCFRDRIDYRTYPGIDGRARLIRLNFTDFSLTLGWQLSQISENIIAAHSGYAGSCVASSPGHRALAPWKWTDLVLNENNCAACEMMYKLTGRAPELNSARSYAEATGVGWQKLCEALPSAPSTPIMRSSAPGVQ
jgi:predicted acylesterase/phospholipase RssA